MIHPYAYYLGRAAAWYPERVAVIEGERRLSYRELDDRANALAPSLPSSRLSSATQGSTATTWAASASSASPRRQRRLRS